MFTGTLRFNLDPEGIVEDERIIKLMKEAQLEEFMLKDPKGLQ
jgi:ABC-type transport system involved in cytochrome bd biosynthesis fused ATPase/permease subunit